MSQNFNTLLGSSIIKNDRETINENFDAVRSCYSGITAPTDNLIAGMMWFDTSTSKLYQLKPNLTTWVQLADLSSSIAIVPKASNADTATNATNDENGNAISGYVANIEQDSSDESVFNVYDGNGSLVTTIVIPKVEIDVMTGASASAGGVAGLVPAPSAGANNLPLCGDGTFKTLPVAGGGTGATTAANARTNLGLGTAVTAASISGKVITLTFADGTTKTLTTQDTNTVPNRYITSKYTSGTSWYEVYNDGWVRQGGLFYLGTAQETNKTVSLLKTMANTNYNVQLTTKVANAYNCWVVSTSKTSFIMAKYNYADNSYYWQVEGQGA